MGKISAWYQGSIEQTALAGCWDQSELGQPGKETKSRERGVGRRRWRGRQQTEAGRNRRDQIGTFSPTHGFL